jgi:hypothetical protein
MTETVELSLETWENTKPEPMELTPEGIAEVDALLTQLAEKCEALGTSFFASFVTSVTGTGQSALHSRIGATPGTLTPEVWCAMFLATGGLDNLLDNMEDLIDSSNARFEKSTKLSLILPSTSIIV